VASNVVIRNIERADQAVIDRLGRAGVATAHEAYGRRGLLEPSIRPRQVGAAIAGSAVTVLCPPGDNMMLHAVVEVLQPGDIVVVSTTSESNDAMFGDLLATSFMAYGAVGLIIEAGVRDTATLREMGFPVWSKVVHAQGTVKATPGSVNVPMVCGGVSVTPGDVVIADDDGAMIVSRAEAELTLDEAEKRLEQETATRERLQTGELGLDLYGMRERLEGLGVNWIDSTDEV
jgi:4-hydroxy-4-methyl-2-oxoglutarate aldolase